MRRGRGRRWSAIAALAGIAAALLVPAVALSADAAADAPTVLPFGGAPDHGSTFDVAPSAPVAGMAPLPAGAGSGYWQVGPDGGVFAFGEAGFHGSLGGMRLNQSVVGMAATTTGGGYWLVAGDGGVFAFGDAGYHGSTGDIRLNQPIVGMAADPHGGGYWLVARDGGVFAFDAAFHGSAADRFRPTLPAVGMAAAPGGGYWITRSPVQPLPRGGVRLLPDYRVVAWYGRPGVPGLGVLGTGAPDDVARRLADQAAAYRPYGRPLQPAFEVIASIATRNAGPDGDYSAPIDGAVLDEWLAAARRHRLLLILDIQPGRTDFLTEARRYERWLKEPDVGLALDPEWRVRAPETPGGGTIGYTDGHTVNRVADYLAGLVQSNGLPQKLLVVHQFTAGMVRDRHLVQPRPELAITFHLDGFGSPAAKISKYDALQPPAPFSVGFKLFYQQDSPLLRPEDVMGLRPPPDLVTYQ